jgi:hypothetical protein
LPSDDNWLYFYTPKIDPCGEDSPLITHQHKGHTIYATAELKKDGNSWTPRLLVQWDSPDRFSHDRPIVFDATFPTKELARQHGLTYAIQWIDAGKPDLPGSRAD